MINTNENEENTNNETSTLDTRQHMLNSENFEAIKQLQDDIYKETEMKPSFRKIINQLITREGLAQVKEKMIKQLRSYD